MVWSNCGSSAHRRFGCTTTQSSPGSAETPIR
jgi:hypothetical protein